MPPKLKRNIQDLKASTKWLGYILVVNSIVWTNIVWYNLYQRGEINACTDITKYTLIIGVILLLGRKAIVEIATRILGKVVMK